MYEIYQGQELKAIVRVQEEGQKEWDFSPDVEYGGFCMENSKEDIEQQMIDHSPNENFHFGGLTIRRQVD
jgi:hypothetical protein